MTALAPCPACGARLMPGAEDFGRSVRCPACRAEFLLRRPETLDVHDDPERGALPETSALRPVPPPRASRTADDASLALTLGAIGILVPVIAPFAWWLAARTSARLRAAGSDVPGTTRTALGLGVFGTLLLVIGFVCALPFLLFA